MTDLATRLLNGDRRALARALSLIETGGPTAHTLLAAIYPATGRAHTIGITGPPGAGKSSLVAALATEWRRRGTTIGILAIDPSSPLSGGAVLGDRIRMQALSGDSGVFIRSMANRGRPGGLARAADDAVALLDAAGFAVVLIETVGAGQGEVAIARSAQSTIVVEVPGLGDGVQAIKAGVLEIADLFVVNKADREGAGEVVRQLRAMLSLGSTATAWETPILTAVATRGEGIAAIIAALEQHHSFQVQQGASTQQAQARAAAALAEALAEVALARTRGANPAAWQAAVVAIAARQTDPYSAATQLLIEPQA